MKAIIETLDERTSSSGVTFYNLTSKQYPNRKMVCFPNGQKLEVGQEIDFNVGKENGDTSWLINLARPKSFSRQPTVDIKLECLKLAVELVKSDKVDVKQLELIAKRLQEIYNKL
jgi:hypothetical protein